MRLLPLAALAVLASPLAAQAGAAAGQPAVTAADVGTVSISVVVPEDTPQLSPAQRNQVDSKLTQIAAQAGLSGSGIDAGFIMFPKLTLEDASVAETGMQNITVVTLDLALFIKQADKNLTFASMSRQLKGSGTSKAQAITQAISKLSASDAEFRTFIQTGKRKILEYYEQNCKLIQAEALRASRTQDYTGALGILFRVPKEAKTCFETLTPDIDFAFKQFQGITCRAALKNANAAVAAQSYVQAVNFLAEVDPFSSCADSAGAIIDKVEAVVNQREDRDIQIALQTYDKQLEALKTMYPTAAALEAHRMQMARDVAVAYYQQQPVVQYNAVIFK